METMATQQREIEVGCGQSRLHPARRLYRPSIGSVSVALYIDIGFLRSFLATWKDLSIKKLTVFRTVFFSKKRGGNQGDVNIFTA